MAGLSPQDATSLFILAIIVVAVARRSYLTAVGTPLSLVRLWAFTVLYIVLFGAVALDELFYLPAATVLGEIGIILGVAVLAAPSVQRRVTVYRDLSGVWSFRIGYLIPVIYLTLFVVRIGMDFAVLGVDPFGPSPSHVAFSTVAIVLLFVVDALYAVSTGLLVARSVAVQRAHHRAVEAETKPAAGPA